MPATCSTCYKPKQKATATNTAAENCTHGVKLTDHCCLCSGSYTILKKGTGTATVAFYI